MRCTSAGLRGDAGWAGPVGGSGGRVDRRREAQTWWSLADLGWATASGSLLVPERGRGGCYAAGRERAERAGWMLGFTLIFCYRDWLGKEGIEKCGKSRITRVDGSAHNWR